VNNLKIIVVISVLLVSGLFVNDAYALDADWSFREQQLTGSVARCGENASFPIAIVGDHLNVINSPVSGVAWCHVFKVFDKADVINRNLNVTWAGLANPFGIALHIQVIDGSYDRTNATDFPLLNNQDGFSNPLKGGGELHSIIVNTNPFNQSDILNMTLTGSTESQVTVAVSLRDGSATNTVTMDVFEVFILGVGQWLFNSNATVTNEVTGTAGADRALIVTDFTNLIDVLPPVLTLIGDDPHLVLKDTFYGDDGASCIDAIEGDISGNVVVNQTAVDTSIVAIFVVTYDCDDSIPNSAIQISRDVQIVEVMPVFAGGGGSGIALGNPEGKGGTTPISKIEDVAILTTPVTPEPLDVDRAFDLFASLNQLFTPTEEVIDEISAPVIPEPLPEITIVEDNFFDAISSFFSSLFGFLFGVQYAYAIPTDEWQFRENAFFSSQGGTFSWTITPAPLLQMEASQAGYEGHTFKVFNKTDIIGNTLLIDWKAVGNSLGSVNHARFRVMDGSYDKDSFVDFPLPVNVAQPTYISKGGGVLEDFFDGQDFSQQITQLNMTLTGSQLDQVTVIITERHGNGGTFPNLDIFSIEFPNFARWEFDSSAVVNNTVIDPDASRGFVNANFTNLADMTAPIITLIGEDPQLLLKDTSYGEQGATCIDDIEGDISGDLVIDPSAVDTSIIAIYQVTYDCDPVSVMLSWVICCEKS